jgi:hypothetical protein
MIVTVNLSDQELADAILDFTDMHTLRTEQGMTASVIVNPDKSVTVRLGPKKEKKHVKKINP